MTARSIAHYNLLDRIGEGGLGEVFRARDTRVGRTVALKLFPGEPGTEGACPESLLADARAVGGISHPNIATLFDIGHADGTCYLAYEFVAGASLRAAMSAGPMNPTRALELAVQSADALADLEAAGVVHGDLRPETIAVTAKGAAKLLDCGLWRWTRGGTIRRIAAADPASLPPDAASIVAYLSPEQAVGPDWDSRGDIFSLGTILYELLTGRNPFSAASPQEVVMNVIRLKPPPVSIAAPGVPTDLDRVLAKALSKDIAFRYESAALFAAALRGVAAKLAEATSGKGEGYLLPLDDRADRVPAPVWLAIGLALALFAAVLFWAVR